MLAGASLGFKEDLILTPSKFGDLPRRAGMRKAYGGNRRVVRGNCLPDMRTSRSVDTVNRSLVNLRFLKFANAPIAEAIQALNGAWRVKWMAR